jgi:hypothetical protein
MLPSKELPVNALSYKSMPTVFLRVLPTLKDSLVAELATINEGRHWNRATLNDLCADLLGEALEARKTKRKATIAEDNARARRLRASKVRKPTKVKIVRAKKVRRGK